MTRILHMLVLCRSAVRVRTQTRCRVLPSGQVGSSSATRIANMWAMQRPRAVPAAAILPLKYGNVPSSGSCEAFQRSQASLANAGRLCFTPCAVTAPTGAQPEA